MSRFPRVALGTVQPDADTQFVSWALLELLTRHACQTQHFFARSSLAPCSGAITATGLASRHLDSWLMTPDLCHELFVRGAGGSELAIIEGPFDAAVPFGGGGSSLDTLCQWLDLPRLVVLDTTRMDEGHLPARPQADALILDRITSAAEHRRLSTSLESLWGIPVVGALEELPALREAVRALPAGSIAPPEVCLELGIDFERFTQVDEIRRLADRRELPQAVDGPSVGAVRRVRKTRTKVTVAVAYDEAFHGYFPDTLDLLELMGATVVDFSPLHDEQLPPGIDLVYIGCGRPDRHAETLADNHCLMSALRNHLCAGRRIYADGGGLAYLCQHLETSSGKFAPMVGVLPAIARLNQPFTPLEPVELTLAERCWLGEPDGKLRGYLNSNWRLEPNGNLTSYFAEEAHKYDLVGRYQALGSRLQINFAAQENFLRAFVEPVGVAAGAAIKG
jgi:cobyrinic acid a,c-diamide synthase